MSFGNNGPLRTLAKVAWILRLLLAEDVGSEGAEVTAAELSEFILFITLICINST